VLQPVCTSERVHGRKKTRHAPPAKAATCGALRAAMPTTNVCSAPGSASRPRRQCNGLLNALTTTSSEHKTSHPLIAPTNAAGSGYSESAVARNTFPSRMMEQQSVQQTCKALETVRGTSPPPPKMTTTFRISTRGLWVAYKSDEGMPWCCSASANAEDRLEQIVSVRIRARWSLGGQERRVSTQEHSNERHAPSPDTTGTQCPMEDTGTSC
jgi:hypothetical protein